MTIDVLIILCYETAVFCANYSLRYDPNTVLSLCVISR